MDLYIMPLAGSFPAHVACLEAGITPRLHSVDRKTKRLEDGREYRSINPTGSVPALALPDGTVLSESVAVLQWIADSAPEARLAPAFGTRERYELMEWLNFITTELHKKHLWNLFSAKTTPELKAWARASAPDVLELLSQRLDGREFVVGDRFSVADAYLYWGLFVAPHGGVPLETFPVLTAYVERIRERPSVKAAFAIEAPLYARQQRAA